MVMAIDINNLLYNLLLIYYATILIPFYFAITLLFELFVNLSDDIVRIDMRLYIVDFGNNISKFDCLAMAINGKYLIFQMCRYADMLAT